MAVTFNGRNTLQDVWTSQRAPKDKCVEGSVLSICLQGATDSLQCLTSLVKEDAGNVLIGVHGIEGDPMALQFRTLSSRRHTVTWRRARTSMRKVLSFAGEVRSYQNQELEVMFVKVVQEVVALTAIWQHVRRLSGVLAMYALKVTERLGKTTEGLNG